MICFEDIFCNTNVLAIALPVVVGLVYFYFLLRSRKSNNENELRDDNESAENLRKASNQAHHKKNVHQQQQQQQQNTTAKPLDATDSGISSSSSQKVLKTRRGGRVRNHLSGTQRNRSANKNVAAVVPTTVEVAAAETTTKYSLKKWFGSEMGFCYENRFESSIAEDNCLPQHNPAHRSSTSSELTAGEEAQISYRNKKKTSRQRRPKRRPHSEINQMHDETTVPMDIGGIEEKENIYPADDHENKKKNNNNSSSDNNNNNSGNKRNVEQQLSLHSTAKSMSVNLRKKCTTTAALKLLQPNVSLGTTDTGTTVIAHELTTSASYSSVSSSSSSLSTSRSSIASSAASSATNSPTPSTNSSPTSSPSIMKRHFQGSRKTKGFISEPDLVALLRPYIVQPEMLRVYGFPVESPVYKRCIEIYKCVPKTVNNGEVQQQQKLNGTQEDFEYHQRLSSSHLYDQLKSLASAASDTSDSSEAGDDEPILTTLCYTRDGNDEILKQYDQSMEKNCMRCKRLFKVLPDGTYLSEEACQYHAGKLVHVFTGKQYEDQFTCCQRGSESDGCEHHSLHVWSGTVVGINGPYTDFKHTQCRYNATQKVYALDCEMCITGRGLEVTKITVVGYDGELVYEHFVRPEAPIVDYNTRFSGITANDLDPSRNTVKTLEEVQNDLLELFDADTILIGHALENDLRALRIVHKTIVDTSIVFPAHHGFPYRRALKALARTYLYRDIQCGNAGHSSLEDSRACLDLMLYRVRHPV